MRVPFSAFAALVLLPLLSACDAEQTCRQHFDSTLEVQACVDGSQFGTATMVQLGYANQGGAVNYAVAKTACANHCRSSFAGVARSVRACTDSCQATIVYVNQN